MRLGYLPEHTGHTILVVPEENIRLASEHQIFGDCFGGDDRPFKKVKWFIWESLSEGTSLDDYKVSGGWVLTSISLMKSVGILYNSSCLCLMYPSPQSDFFTRWQPLSSF